MKVAYKIHSKNPNFFLELVGESDTIKSELLKETETRRGRTSSKMDSLEIHLPLR